MRGNVRGMKIRMTERRLSTSINRWPPEWRERYEERAAILEFDGGYDRGEAEARAKYQIEIAYASGGDPIAVGKQQFAK